MVTKIQKWGNSQGVRFPKAMLEELLLMVGDEVEMTIEDGRIIVQPVRLDRKKYNIAHLVAEMPPEYQVEEVNWGEPEGKEAW